ncbi:stage VI sporulation protein F [Gorillibacterium timonense]|uniref:stage VI sporulation protein F n=1 Tax=Gorillibacterium timonense TaxID=1689269 RepID=UPI00071D9450|nr:stage VI sporulation protein F [Gorillibacterium timonense]
MGKNVSKDVLNLVKNKTGKSVTEKDIKSIADGVTPSTTQDEQQLRKLIKQVSAMVNVPVSEETTKEIIQAVKGTGGKMNLGLDSLMKILAKKK